MKHIVNVQMIGGSKQGENFWPESCIEQGIAVGITLTHIGKKSKLQSHVTSIS